VAVVTRMICIIENGASPANALIQNPAGAEGAIET
jgi:hypothetical protein